MATSHARSRAAVAVGLLSSLVLLSACAVSPEKAAANLSDEERVVCTREVPTGRMGVLTLCRTVAEMRLQREAVLRQMDEVRSEGTKN